MIFLAAVFLVVLVAGRILEALGWAEIALWVLAFAVLSYLLWPAGGFAKSARGDWIPLMIGEGVLDVSLLFRTGLQDTRAGRTFL